MEGRCLQDNIHVAVHREKLFIQRFAQVVFLWYFLLIRVRKKSFCNASSEISGKVHITVNVTFSGTVIVFFGGGAGVGFLGSLAGRPCVNATRPASPFLRQWVATVFFEMCNCFAMLP